MREDAVSYTHLDVYKRQALRRAIQSATGLHPEIKWPNDIVIGGKKVAGILTELSAELDRVKHVIPVSYTHLFCSGAITQSGN